MMKRLLVLGVVAALAVPAMSVPVAADANPYVGSWQHHDIRDGGEIHVRIGGDHHIVASDPISTICSIATGEFVRGSLAGFGEINDDGDLTLDSTVYCNSTGSEGGGRLDAGIWNVTLHDNGDGTLTWEPFGFVFHRTGHVEH